MRDNAVFASAEYRLPLGHEAGVQGLNLALFGDFGHGWNREGPSLPIHSIYSLGCGLVWNPHPALHTEIYWGIHLTDIENLGSSLQDDGIHFRMVWRPQS